MIEGERIGDVSTDGRVDKAMGSQLFKFSAMDEVGRFESRTRQKMCSRAKTIESLIITLQFRFVCIS
ncbi:hypothetical protein Y032_0002g1145 [Ancylostoma ceylanicum]|uniref:Uncharacterized protein n=1 Tax=Ancylostoma ceylanicum TaxID=53326 RepID=A0A016VZV9_9BILA|nr:hypothetical protein Y032_0002g1145 [Ancylostoma ceylanicum]